MSQREERVARNKELALALVERIDFDEDQWDVEVDISYRQEIRISYKGAYCDEEYREKHRISHRYGSFDLYLCPTNDFSLFDCLVDFSQSLTLFTENPNGFEDRWRCPTQRYDFSGSAVLFQLASQGDAVCEVEKVLSSLDGYARFTEKPTFVFDKDLSSQKLLEIKKE